MVDAARLDWKAIAAESRFQELHHKKSRFLWGLMIFSVVYYFLLPIGAALVWTTTGGIEAARVQIDRIRPVPVDRLGGAPDALRLGQHLAGAQERLGGHAAVEGALPADEVPLDQVLDWPVTVSWAGMEMLKSVAGASRSASSA